MSAGSTVPLVATVNVPNNAVPGTYNVSVHSQDSSGIPSHSLAFPLTVQDFALSSSTASQTVTAGGTTGAYNLTVQPIGTSFTNPVSLSCSGGLPSGAQCNFQPSAPITPGSAPVAVAMTILTSSTTSAGTSTLTVTATSGLLSHSAVVSLIVTNPIVSAGDFQLAVVQAFPNGVAAGSQVQAKVSVTSNYAGSVNASCDASAISGQCVVTPTKPVTISASVPVTLAVTVNIPNTMAAATYNINVTVADSSGMPSHTQQLPLTVIQDFSVTSATPSQTLGVGQATSGPYQLTVAPNPTGSSFAGAVTLSCSSGLPAAAHCIFAPAAPVTLGSSSAAVVMSISTAADKMVVWPLSTHTPVLYALSLLLPGIVIGWTAVGAGSPKCKATLLGVTMLLLPTLSLLSCGGVSSAAKYNPTAQTRRLSNYGDRHICRNNPRCWTECGRDSGRRLGALR